MSIIRSLQDYLKEYPGMRPADGVMTDCAPEDPPGYALAPSGGGETSRDVIGSRTYHNSYIFYAREAALSEADRQDNYSFLEAFSDWLNAQSENGIFPVLPAGYEAAGIAASGASLKNMYGDGTGLYQVQIQFTFRKRGV